MRAKSIAKKNITPGIICTAPWRVTKVIAMPNYKLEVAFIDGTHGVIDIRGLIMSGRAGIFEQLKNITLFNQVHVNYGVVTWPGEIDLAPDAMHQAIQKNGTWILK